MIILAALIASPGVTNTRVRVDDRLFRVEVRGREVRVSDKAILTKPSLKRRAQMRAAVVEATQCKIVDDYWAGARLEGLLDCSR